MFRQLVSSNAKHFGTLTTDEKEKFATNLCNQLRERGHRFLRPVNKNAGMYEHLDHEQSFKKVHHALSVCRSKDKGSSNAVSVASLSESYDFTQVAKKPPPASIASSNVKKAPPIKKEKTSKYKPGAHLHKPLGPLLEKKFDDVAKAAIATLLSRREFEEAMEKNWGDDKDRRRQICEEQVRSFWLVLVRMLFSLHYLSSHHMFYALFLKWYTLLRCCTATEMQHETECQCSNSLIVSCQFYWLQSVKTTVMMVTTKKI